MNRFWIGTLGLAIAGCSKTDRGQASSDTQDAGHAPVVASATSSSSAAPAVAPARGAWSGRYDAAPGTFSVPDGGEWAGVRFRGEDAQAGLGDGTLAVSVSSEGRVEGKLEGPLGPLRVTGELLEKSFSAALVSADPAHGFSGTAVGTRAGERITGTMRLSLPTGNVLREATFTLEGAR